jgi:hypothetical protein
MSIIDSFAGMLGYVKQYHKDNDGNHWYTSLNGVDSSLANGKTFYNMHKRGDKEYATRIIAPISIVTYRIGSMFSNYHLFVVDKENNELDTPDYSSVRSILKNPNILQEGHVFFKVVEMTLKIWGFCPIYTLRATKNSIPSALWVIPPCLFRAKTTGKLWNQTKLSGIINEAYIKWNGEKLNLSEDEYFIIYNSDFYIDSDDDELKFRSPLDAHSYSASNWLNQMVASNTLIVDGGSKGILYEKTSDEFGNVTLTEKEKDRINSQFQNKYGLVGKKFAVMVSGAKNLAWLPLNYDAKQLRLDEEGRRCMDYISNAFGINVSMFVESKYENQKEAKKAAFQDVIIPDSLQIAQSLQNLFNVNGLEIKFDYTHIEILQADKMSNATALQTISTAMKQFLETGVMTKLEARIELSKYVDINPEKPLE